MTIEEAYIKYKEIYDFAEINIPLENLVDVETLKKTPVAPTLETGLAYEGSILYHTIMVWFFAQKVANIYEKISPVNIKSLAKVVVLHQLGKIGMFTPNTNDWEVKKLGKVYGFTDKGCVLKNGEISKLICGNAGINFTLQEYEAMSILDKTPEEYENMTKYRTSLSTTLKISSDFAFASARERQKKEGI
jgi:hypothetical protein